MEWIETTARTVEEAKEAALDLLGIDEAEAEFEILEEPRSGLFGRTRGEARVRARVRPRAPRPKADRRRRHRGRPTGGSNGEQRTSRSRTGSSRSKRKVPADAPGSGGPAPAPAEPAPTPAVGPLDTEPDADATPAPVPAAADPVSAAQEDDMTTTDTQDDQIEYAERFLSGLVDAFGLDGEVEAVDVDGGVEMQINGSTLGLLIGARGQTLAAVQDLLRTALQREYPGDRSLRVRLEIAGYRERRRQALERFAHQIAAEVRETGQRKALEPMGSADRKAVHDAVNEMDGITTISEGEDPYRRVVILPADAAGGGDD